MISKYKNSELGALLAVASSFFYASYGIWTKLIGDSWGDGYAVSALRSIIVVLILLHLALIFKKTQPLNLKRNYKSILGMIVFSCLIWGPLYYAILESGVGIGLTVAYVSIVIGGFIFGWIFNQEHFTKLKLISLLMGSAGLVLIYYSQVGTIKILPILAAIISGLATSANTSIVKNINYSSTQSTLVLWYTSIIANLSMAFILKESPPVGSAVNYLYLILFATSSILATLMLVRAVKMIELGLAGILGLTEIVFAVLLGVLLFDEGFSIQQFIGILIIMLACSLQYINSVKLKFLR